MLITEMVTIHGRQFRRNYSDAGFYIIREDGQKFEEALDLPEVVWVYTESDEKIPEPEVDLEVLENAE